jgi:Zn-dependent protease with chaperone function
VIYVAHYPVTLLLCWCAACHLLSSRWPARSPRTALLAWQLVGFAASLSVIGFAVAVGLAPYDRGAVIAVARLAADLARGTATQRLTPLQLAIAAVGIAVAGWLLAVTVRHIVHTLRHRARHRDILALVGEVDPQAGGTLVIDYSGPAAYCLPGRHSRIVVSEGARRLLDEPQLQAVIAHERAHASERHDLVLLPFAALHRALPRSRTAAAAMRAVALLVEMRADDRAARHSDAHSLAAALRRFAAHGGGPAPEGALGADGSEVAARVARLVEPAPPPPLVARLALLTVALTIAATPVSLFVLPL